MYTLADSHIHLFQCGFNGSGIDEVAAYEQLIEEHSIEAALVVGYEGEDWARGNNDFIAGLAESRSWLYPLAYLAPSQISVNRLEALSRGKFVGISLYLFNLEDVTTIERVRNEVWEWIVARGWLISVNSKGDSLRVWLKILERIPQLRVVISHLGLPQIKASAPALQEIAVELENQRLLHNFENVYLKLSGFYALEPTAPPFPYSATYPYFQFIIENFADNRLIWGSDFTPALDKVSFTETFAHFKQWLSHDEELSTRLLGRNLIELLG